MDATIRINDGNGIVSYSWAGFEMHRIAYPPAYPPRAKMTMIASVSSSKGYFAWLSSDGYLLTTEILSGAHIWVKLTHPLFTNKYRYLPAISSFERFMSYMHCMLWAHLRIC